MTHAKPRRVLVDAPRLKLLTAYAAPAFCKLYIAFLQARRDFAPAGATRGLSGRPLDPFGPMLVETFANYETESFAFSLV